MFRAALAVSLDGFIAARDGGVDWLNPFSSEEVDFEGFMRGFGAVVIGRKTYDEAAARAGHPPWPGRCVVLTHRPIPKPEPGIAAFGGDLRELAGDLRDELSGTGKDVWLMGGGISIDAFRAAGLLDRLELSVMPVLLGGGTPLFPQHERRLESLRLVESKTLKNGVLSVTYEPVRR